MLDFGITALGVGGVTRPGGFEPFSEGFPKRYDYSGLNLVYASPTAVRAIQCRSLNRAIIPETHGAV